MSDLSMLVFRFRGLTFVVYLRTTKVHNNSVFKELTLHFLLQKSHLWNSPCLRISHRKYPPCPQNSIIVNPPSPSEILKAVRGMVWIFCGIAQLVSKMALKKWNMNFCLEYSTWKNRTTFSHVLLLPEIFHWNNPKKLCSIYFPTRFSRNFLYMIQPLLH